MAKDLVPIIIGVKRVADEGFGRGNIHVARRNHRPGHMPAPLPDVIRQCEKIRRIVLLNPLIPHGPFEAERVIGVIDVREIAGVYMDRARNETVDRVLNSPVPLIVQVTVADGIKDFVVGRIKSLRRKSKDQPERQCSNNRGLSRREEGGGRIDSLRAGHAVPPAGQVFAASNCRGGDRRRE